MDLVTPVKLDEGYASRTICRFSLSTPPEETQGPQDTTPGFGFLFALCRGVETVPRSPGTERPSVYLLLLPVSQRADPLFPSLCIIRLSHSPLSLCCGSTRTPPRHHLYRLCTLSHRSRPPCFAPRVLHSPLSPSRVYVHTLTLCGGIYTANRSVQSNPPPSAI